MSIKSKSKKWGLTALGAALAPCQTAVVIAGPGGAGTVALPLVFANSVLHLPPVPAPTYNVVALLAANKPPLAMGQAVQVCVAAHNHNGQHQFATGPIVEGGNYNFAHAAAPAHFANCIVVGAPVPFLYGKGKLPATATKVQLAS